MKLETRNLKLALESQLRGQLRREVWLAGLLQCGASGAAGWACASADEHHDGVKVGVERLRLTLDPAPLTKGALVNEGEGTDFVCHTAFDAEMGQLLSYGGTGPCGQG